MAKVINISTDGGTVWRSLPGSEGSFNADGEPVDDTILGQTYQSSDIGMVGWGVSANAIFKGFSGYLAEIKKQGTPTSMTAEAMTLVGGKTFAIDDGTKEIWDRTSGSFDIIDGGGSISNADILNVDYLFGRVTFIDSFTPSGSVTVTGDFFPVVTIARPNSYTLTMSAEAINESDFASAQGNSGHNIFVPGLRTVALELGGIFDDTEDVAADVIAREELIIQIDPAGDGSSIARGFFKIISTGQSGAVGALEEETIQLQLTVPDETTNPGIELPFNWRHTATTLNQSIQDLLTSWLTELNTYDLQYLPQGTEGQSPLDGREGNFMVTDISLSGGLSNMNIFAAELQGTGEFTTV